MNEPEIILQASNENETLVAVVEQDQRVAYFYIYPTDEFSERFNLRACWLRNLLPAPQEDDHQAVAAGKAPLLAAAYCHELAGQAPLDATQLELIWAESDDGAALWYQDQLLAVIPGWSLYLDQPVSYAAGCSQPGPLVFPLGDASENAEHALAIKTRQFWRNWQQPDTSPWPELQASFLDIYEQHFGPSLKYYAIDQGKWPPMAISQHEKEGVHYFLTLGVSIRAQPWVASLFGEQAGEHRRMEMAMAIDGQYMDEANALQMASALSGFAQVPWGRISWLGEGHTLESAVAPPGYEGYILSHAFYPDHASLVLPTQGEDSVNLYWASPVFTSERQMAHSVPNGGLDLVDKLRFQGVNHIFRPRPPVA